MYSMYKLLSGYHNCSSRLLSTAKPENYFDFFLFIIDILGFIWFLRVGNNISPHHLDAVWFSNS